MKIAFVVPYVPNLIRTRPYNLITHLAAQGHEVTVFTVGSGMQDAADAAALREKCTAVHYYVQPVWRSLLNSALAVPSSQPLQSVYSWHRRMADELAQRVARKGFEVVHVEHLRGSRYATFVKSRFPKMPVVWDSVDCISHLFQQASHQSQSFFGRFITRFELIRTRKAEGSLICRFNHALVTSTLDQKALLELAPAKAQPQPISVLPNGVDLTYFKPNPALEREPATLVFSGKMSYHANIAMVKFLMTEIMPRVWAQRPATRLTIAGKDPPADIREFGKNPLVTITGTVEDIRPYLWRATASVVPLLYGAGIQNKILEAMATATPVVTTSRAASAIGAVPGREILVSDTADGFASELLRLMDHDDFRMAIGNAGLKYVQTTHDWANIVSRLVDIYYQTL
jgi:glycosyltransferase involved in cell wall biosynthesis